MIDLIHDYFIDTDPRNYILKRRYVSKNKKGEMVQRSTVIGYYLNIASAVNGAKEHYQREKLSDDNFTLNEAIEVIKTLNAEFIKILSEKIGG